MTCEQAIEILPWYLNGTLEAREREEVRHHLATCEACRQALTETREAWRIFDQHLPSEVLVALAWGKTPTGIDPALAERHLAGCPQCAADLELARTSRHLEEDDRIALFPGKLATAAPRETRGDGESRTWRRAALAASLAAVIGISGWIYSAQVAGPGTEVPPQIAQTPEPEVNVTPLTLNPEEILRGERGEGTLDEEEQVVRAEVTTPLFLNPSDEAATYETFEIEIRKPGKEPFWQRRDLRLTEEGDFSLTLPPGFLKPGTYEIRVFGLRDGQRDELVGVYQVRVR